MSANPRRFGQERTAVVGYFCRVGAGNRTSVPSEPSSRSIREGSYRFPRFRACSQYKSANVLLRSSCSSSYIE